MEMVSESMSSTRFFGDFILLASKSYFGQLQWKEHLKLTLSNPNQPVSKGLTAGLPGSKI